MFALCLLPLAGMLWDVYRETLGPDPVAALEHRSGDWALRLLLVTLAVSPLRQLTGVAAVLRFRRPLGLFAFFYASLHFAIYLFVDLGGFWRQVFEEIVKRPLHHGRLSCLAVAAATRHHLDQGHDAPPRPQLGATAHPGSIRSACWRCCTICGS